MTPERDRADREAPGSGWGWVTDPKTRNPIMVKDRPDRDNRQFSRSACVTCGRLGEPHAPWCFWMRGYLRSVQHAEHDHPAQG